MTKASIVARLALSSALMRSTKLAVFENQLEELIKQCVVLEIMRKIMSH